jgi:hypothetical protein
VIGVALAGRGTALTLAIYVATPVLIAAAVVGGAPTSFVAAPLLALVGTTLVVQVYGHRLVAWQSLLALIVAVILFIPIRRYGMPGHLPFQLEPYRIAVALVVAAWLAAMLVDPRVKPRRSRLLEGPLLALFAAAILSDAANLHRIQDLAVGSTVVKKLTFLLSYLLFFYLFISVIRRRAEIDFVLKTLVAGGALVALSGLVEFRTHFNLFDHLSSFIPFLRLEDTLSTYDVARGGHHRIYASAQHPIALGALLMMLAPLAVCLARTSGKRRWWAAAAVLLMAALATLSRTGILMLIAIGIMFLWLRPMEVKRLWPLLVPALLVVHLALPGTIGTFKASFFPKGGIVASQEVGAGGSGAGRVADLGPAFKEFGNRPVLGAGWGTRVVDGPNPNAQIYDNQWLSTLVEAGAFGIVAWVWLFVRFVRRLGKEAKRDLSERGWLLTGIAASSAGFAVGMFTYDAFSFIQVTFVQFILLALGTALLQTPRPYLVRGDDAATR